VRYISVEPMLERFWLADVHFKINWIINGAQTKPYKPPEIDWVEEIVRACDRAEIPVFLKYNLVGHILIEEPFYKNDGSAQVRKTPLKQGTKPLKRGRVKGVSPKQKVKNREWNALVAHLIEHRAYFRDELDGSLPDWRGLQGHHIIKRSQGGTNTAGNCFILNAINHDHTKYGSGIPIKAEQALFEVALLNKEHGIHPELIGKEVLEMKG